MSEPRPVSGLTPYINVDGAAKAMEFYGKAFGAVEHERNIPEGGDRVMHGMVEINGAPLFISDFFPDYGFPPVTPQAFNLHLQVEDAKQWFDRAIAAGCTIAQPLEVQFWGDLYGQVKDPYGITWAIGETKTPAGQA